MDGIKFMRLNHFYNEDCFNTMDNMIKEDFQVDAILTSPPYNTARVGNSYMTQKARDNGYGRYDIYSEFETNQEYIDWTIDLFHKFNKIVRENGVVIYNLSYGAENTEVMWRTVYNILEDTPFTIADNIIWKKDNALPSPASPNRLTRICEYIYIFVRENEMDTFHTNKQISKVGNNGQTYYHTIDNFIEAPNNDGANKLNKATYSTELCRKLLNIYVKPQSIVYDPFMGTGTTANACKLENINYIGSELSNAQVEYSKKRLNYNTLDQYV